MKDEITNLPIKPVLLINKQENPLDIDSLSDEELDKILSKSPEIADKKINNDIGSQEVKKLNLEHLSTKKKLTNVKDIVKNELLKIKKKEFNINKNRDVSDIEQQTDKEIKRRDDFSEKGITQYKWQSNKTNDSILSKQSTNEPLLIAERKKILIQNQLNKREIANEIYKKRTILKDLDKIILNKNECKCEDQFSYIGETGVIVSTCKKCSRSKEWKNVNEWYKYIQQSKKDQQND